MKRRLPTHLILLTLFGALSLVLLETGCGGSGSMATATTPSNYVFDSLTAPITESGVIPSGYASNGAWTPIATDTSVSLAGGFYVGSTFTAFPVGQFTGDEVSIESAGGHYAWATVSKPNGAVATAILDTSTGNIVTVDNVALSNEGVASPDGTSAFMSVYDSSGSDTGTYEIVSATGTVTALPIPSTPGYTVAARSVKGWTVVNSDNTPQLRRAGTGRSVASKVRAQGDGSTAPLLISPSGAVVALQNTNAQVNCVNNNGISAGFDTIAGVDYPVRWDTSGKETVLKGLGAGGTGRIWGIADSGVMVGGVDDGTIPMMWQADGTASNMASRVTVTGKEAFTEGLEIQANGKIFGYGTDLSGNSALVAITPSS